MDHMTWAPRSFQRRMALARDGGACRYCGRRVYPAVMLSKDQWHDVGLTFDHFFPRYHQGPSEVWNLFVSCYRCNAEKRNTPPLQRDGWRLLPTPKEPVPVQPPNRRGLIPRPDPWPLTHLAAHTVAA